MFAARFGWSDSREAAFQNALLSFQLANDFHIKKLIKNCGSRGAFKMSAAGAGTCMRLSGNRHWMVGINNVMK
jgi:hypothetical protein